MNAINTFISDMIAFENDATSSVNDVRNAYVAFNHGSTEGKVKVISTLEKMNGVSKQKISGRQVLRGLRIKQQPTKPMKPVVSQPDDGLSAYERAKLKIKEKQLQQQKEAEEERLQQQKETEERNAAIEKERLQQQKETEKERLQQQKETEKERLQQQKETEERNAAIAQQNTMLKEKKIQVQKEIAEMKKQSQEKLKQMDIEDRERDREFIREENNKNRRMYLTAKFNKYTDFRVYGSPARQYIACDSAMDVLGFNLYNTTGIVEKATLKIIEDAIANISESIPVIERGSMSNINAIDVSNISQIVDAIASQSNIHLESIIDKATFIQDTAIADEHRHIKNEYTTKKEKQQPTKYSKMKPKTEYLRALNEVRMEGDRMKIKCYCCQKEIFLDSSACHRSHDIPRSDGGDCSKDNIYLCCSTCNHDMSDELSVIEYKTQIYAMIISDPPK